MTAPPRTVYRIRFRDRALRITDCGTFVSAMRAVRAVYPGVDFGAWSEAIQVPSGNRCMSIAFGVEGIVLGRLFELELKGPVPA